MVEKKVKLEAQNPLILRCQRLMEAFAKSDDERDFYLDRQEGFIVYVDLDKPQEDLNHLENELKQNPHRYCLIPKFTFYEIKKIMEGFVNEKVYDIDTKEKLLDIIQSKDARDNFLEFIYDHHAEFEKWQQYYQERSRIRIIEWLRQNNFHFVFEEDLDLTKTLIEKLKKDLFVAKAGKDVIAARKILTAKAKTYYSSEALNPRPKRGRPPKQAAKLEIEPQVSIDIYTTVPLEIRPFLFTPELTSSTTSTFSSKFDNDMSILTNRRSHYDAGDLGMESLQQKLAALRQISGKWIEAETPKPSSGSSKGTESSSADFFDIEEESEMSDFPEDPIPPSNAKNKNAENAGKKIAPKAAAKKEPSGKAKPAPKRPALRSIIKKTSE